MKISGGERAGRSLHFRGNRLFARAQRKAIVFIGALDNKTKRAIEFEGGGVICINFEHNRLLAVRAQGCNGFLHDLATMTAPAILRAHEKPIRSEEHTSEL